MKRISTLRLFFVTVAVFLASGCSLKIIAVNQTAEILGDAGAAFNQETDLEFAALAIPASIKTAEGFLQAHPTQPILLKVVAEGYVNYGVGFLEDEAESLQEDYPDQAAHLRRRAREFYRRSRGYGFRLIATDLPELADTLRAGKMPSDELLAEVGEDEMPGLFWTGMAWLAYINQSKMYPGEIVNLPIAKRILQRCIEVDETYFHAGALMTLAAVDAGVPQALGGSPVEATKKFKQVMEITKGEHLMSYVLYGKMVGLQTGDKALYVSQMKKVLAADPDVNKDLALANRLAQRRAERYLAEADDLFL